jgi:hypothetical protein
MTRTRRADLFGEQLPRHDVRVMLQFADDDFIARADVFAAVTLRDEVDGLGGAADENDFLGVRRAEEFADLFAAGLKQFRRARGQRVRGAVDVGVVAA